jgi:hypothetical protein
LSRRFRNPGAGQSQGGEDGIIREIFRRLEVERGWFVELGAHDGVHFSNTYPLRQKGWSGVGIECDPDRYRELQSNVAGTPYVAICKKVSRTGPDSLDAILAETALPRDFDLLSLDVDGLDYWVWESLREFRPAVVVIEYNPFFSATEAKTLPFVDNYKAEWPYYGASAAAFDKLGRSRGYMLVGYTGGLNLFFVREDVGAGKFARVPVSCVPSEPRQAKDRWTGWSIFQDV